MKKKILIFSLAYFPKHVGGAEVAIKEITDRLSPEEFEFHLVCNRYDSTLPKVEQIGNVLVHRIGYASKNPSMADLKKLPLQLNKLTYQWWAYHQAKKLHKKHKYDGIWAMMAHATGVPAGKFKTKFPEVKYLLTLQEGDPPAYILKKMKMFGQAFYDAFEKADRLQVISNFLGRWAVEMGFKGQAVMIPNAVNTAHFTQEYSNEELREVRSGFGVSDNDVLMVTTSRLVHKNAVDDVIASLEKLPEKVKFVVFGIGPDEEKLKQQAKDLGVADRVLFRGQITHDVMPKYLKACDIFIRPSRSEGMGNSFVEAMAAELPVIATQEGGIADFLFDSKRNPERRATGWAVDPDSPELIAEAVSEIMENEEEVKSVLERAKTMAIEKYDWDLIAGRMEHEVFAPLLNDK